MVRRDITSYKQVHASSSPLDRAESYCQDKDRMVASLRWVKVYLKLFMRQRILQVQRAMLDKDAYSLCN